jgi:hypothetical protein
MRDAASEDFTELVVVRLTPARSRSRSPAPASVLATSHTWLASGRGLLPALRRPPGDLPLRRPAGDDRRVGTIFGEEGVNIVSAGVGREPRATRPSWRSRPTRPVHESTIDRILELDGFFVGRAVSL